MTILYVLQLSEEKWFIGKTNDPNFTLDEGIYSIEYVRINSPASVYKIIPNCDDFDLDKYVKIFMNSYGIENVRGGSYSNPELSEEEKFILKRELNTANNKYINCGQRHNEYEFKGKRLSIMELKKKVENLTIDYDKLKSELNEFKTDYPIKI